MSQEYGFDNVMTKMASLVCAGASAHDIVSAALYALDSGEINKSASILGNQFAFGEEQALHLLLESAEEMVDQGIAFDGVDLITKVAAKRMNVSSPLGDASVMVDNLRSPMGRRSYRAAHASRYPNVDPNKVIAINRDFSQVKATPAGRAAPSGKSQRSNYRTKGDMIVAGQQGGAMIPHGGSGGAMVKYKPNDSSPAAPRKSGLGGLGLAALGAGGAYGAYRLKKRYDEKKKKSASYDDVQGALQTLSDAGYL